MKTKTGCVTHLWLILIAVVSFQSNKADARLCYDNGDSNVTELQVSRVNSVDDIYIRYYLGPSLCDYEESVLAEWGAMLSARGLQPDRGSTLYIHGFTESPLSESAITVGRAYMKRGDINYFFLDWSNMNERPYFFNALPNCPKVANETAERLSTLFEEGLLQLSSFHVVGHSLGGQIAGMLGKALIERGILLPRISGLDPAGPGFNTEVYSTVHLEDSDAEFVDVVHTDATKFGTQRHSGHADFWPNGGVMQPGCPEDSVREQVFCSHQRSWIYWAESVLNPHAFEARRIPPVTDVRFLRDTDWQNETMATVYMGIDADRSSRGDYFLITNSKSPHGRGHEGLN